MSELSEKFDDRYIIKSQKGTFEIFDTKEESYIGIQTALCRILNKLEEK